MSTTHLPQRIRDARLAAGLTQQIVAARAGLSHLTVSRWEVGTKLPSLGALQKVAIVLNMALADLLDPAEQIAACREPSAPDAAAPPLSALGAHIRAARLAANLTPAHLAPLVSAPSGRTIERWEAGESDPSLVVVQRLANVLGLRLRDLLLGPDINGYPCQPPNLVAGRGAKHPTLTTLQRTLAARLRSARLTAGLTQMDLARVLDLPHARVMLWEARGTPTVEELGPAARALATSIDYLMGLGPDLRKTALHRSHAGA